MKINKSKPGLRPFVRAILSMVALSMVQTGGNP